MVTGRHTIEHTIVLVCIRCTEVIAVFLTFRKWTAIYLMCLVLVVCIFTIILRYGESMPVSGDIETIPDFHVFIIDPGHGGEDGGAVGTDGTIESIINLEIAMKIAELTQCIGWDARMTRTEDISIHDSDAETLRQKKVSDLKNRVDFCEKIENAVLISIHQNTLPGAPKVRGAQVFYNSMEGSRELAIQIQEQLNKFINEKNGK